MTLAKQACNKMSQLDAGVIFEPFDSFLGVAHQAELQTADSDLSAVQCCLFQLHPQCSAAKVDRVHY